MNCLGCQGQSKWHAAFPNRSNKLISLLRQTKQAATKSTRIADKNPQAALQHLKNTWQETTGRALEDDLLKEQNTTLIRKPNHAEMKRQVRAITRKMKEKQQIHLDEIAMDSCLQDRISFSAWERPRKRVSQHQQNELVMLKAHHRELTRPKSELGHRGCATSSSQLAKWYTHKLVSSCSCTQCAWWQWWSGGKRLLGKPKS